MANWWITFHGDGGIVNIQTFAMSGAPTSTALLATGVDGEPALDELRGFVFGSAGVLVANASGDDSAILSFAPPAPNQWGFSQGVFISDQLTHPFDIVPAFSGDLYVSNQSHKGAGGNVITFYHPKSGAYKGTFATGFAELRGLAFDGTYLYAADTGAGTVTPYDDKGNAQTALPIKKADHLYYDGSRFLYIASESDGIYLYDTAAGTAGKKATLPLFLDASSASPALDEIAGFAFGTDSNVYVASRKGNAIQSYPVDLTQTPPTCQSANGKPFITNLGDSPEFIRLGP
jgi:hypothetical protein